MCSIAGGGERLHNVFETDWIKTLVSMATESPHRLIMGKMVQRVSLELSDREKFCNIFRISEGSFSPNFGFPYMFYTVKLLPQLKIG